jgi:hypothetical protein
MIKLPAQGQDFSLIRLNNCLYIDKTEYIYKLITNPGSYFLSRPRRFGKSLLLSALAELFRGRQELFKGLWIDSSGYDFKKYPVLKLTMTGPSDTPEALQTTIMNQLENAASDNGLSVERTSPSIMLTKIMIALKQRAADKKGEKTVVLIDEYDAPVHSVISSPAQAEKILKELHDFYVSFKTYADNGDIHFVLVTGVTKFAKAAIFSGFNNLDDLTLQEKYNGICGFTISEFEAYFKDYLPEFLRFQIDRGYAAKTTTETELKDMILAQYDGYSWDGRNRILNPYSLVKCFNENKLMSYWYGSGSPTFLMNLIKNKPMEYIESDIYPMSVSMLDSAEIDHLDLIPILFQSGYLTVDRLATTREGLVSAGDYILRSPNLEVSSAFGSLILQVLTSQRGKTITSVSDMIQTALRHSDSGLLTKAFAEILTWPSSFEHIPYERYYQTIFHLVLKCLNYRVKAEDNTYKGRTDLAVYFGKETVFVIEFKHEKLEDASKVSEEAAVQLLDKLLIEAKNQIMERDYVHDYENDGFKVKKLAVAIAGRTAVAAEIF